MKRVRTPQNGSGSGPQTGKALHSRVTVLEQSAAETREQLIRIEMRVTSIESQMATKADLAPLASREQLTAFMLANAKETKEAAAAVQKQIHDLAVSSRGETQALRTEMHEQGESLRKEMHEQGDSLRKEMHEQGDSLRKEMHEQGESLRKEMHEQGDSLRKEMHEQGDSLRKEIQEGMAALQKDMGALAVSVHKAINDQTWKYLGVTAGLATLAFTAAKYVH